MPAVQDTATPPPLDREDWTPGDLLAQGAEAGRRGVSPPETGDGRTARGGGGGGSWPGPDPPYRPGWEPLAVLAPSTPSVCRPPGGADGVPEAAPPAGQTGEGGGRDGRRETERQETERRRDETEDGDGETRDEGGRREMKDETRDGRWRDGRWGNRKRRTYFFWGGGGHRSLRRTCAPARPAVKCSDIQSSPPGWSAEETYGRRVGDGRRETRDNRQETRNGKRGSPN